jgi:hypothetical protein
MQNNGLKDYFHICNINHAMKVSMYHCLTLYMNSFVLHLNGEIFSKKDAQKVFSQTKDWHLGIQIC